MKSQRPATAIRRSPTRKFVGNGHRLRAHTAFANDLGYEPEPHMKLSRALFIVVLMHIVVIAGLFGFQSLRDRAGTSRPDLDADSYPRTITASGVDDPSTARIHYVRRGESLSSIAAYYGVPVKELATANSIIDASQILVGQELKIPARTVKGPEPLDIDNIAALTRTATAPAVRPASQEVRSRPKSAPPAQESASEEENLADAALREQFLEAKQGRGGTTKNTSEAALKTRFLESKSQTSEIVAPVPALASSAATSAQASGPRTYIVEKGDNPVAIARRFNVSYSELLKVNNISDPRKLQVGQKLVIPRQ